jgi:hypothetical protein
MNYRVEWAPRAEQQLAAVWVAATDRGAVTAAAHWLDDELARGPLRLGDPVDSSVHRVGSFDVLGIEFEIVEDDKLVIVQGVFAAE